MGPTSYSDDERILINQAVALEIEAGKLEERAEALRRQAEDRRFARVAFAPVGDSDGTDGA